MYSSKRNFLFGNLGLDITDFTCKSCESVMQEVMMPWEAMEESRKNLIIIKVILYRSVSDCRYHIALSKC